MYQQKKSLLFGALALLLSFFSLQMGHSQGFTVIITINQPISCNGAQDGQITASVPGAGGGFQYLWSTGATTAMIQGLGAGSYLVSVTSVAGGSAIATASLTQPLPLALNIQANGTITCANPSIQLTAQASGGIQPYQYFWLSGQVDSTLIVSEPGTYEAILTDQNGCTISNTANAPFDTELPIINGVDSATLLCQGNIVAIEKICTNSTVVGYQWFAPNGQPIPNGNNPSLGVDSIGNYKIQVTNYANGCLAVDSVLVLSDYLNSVPTNQGPVYLDSIVILTTGGVPTYSHIWRTITGTLQSTEQNLTNAPSGTYFLTTSDAAGCTHQSEPFQLQNTSGIISLEEAGIRAFPNPVTNVLNLDLPNEPEIKIQVYNTLGQLTAVKILEGPIGTIDLTGWPSGQYVVQLGHRRGISTLKLVKE